jgi:fido (protein-threonine AMPylation protein)
MNGWFHDTRGDAATPLSPEEQAQIIPTYITNRAQLNEAEQVNITEAELWAFNKSLDGVRAAFIMSLHKRMFRTYPTDEIGVRFHHRLVFIHPFPQGNGRHARLAADLLIVSLGNTRFSWGSANLVEPAGARASYIRALRSADGHEIEPLLSFARS